MIHYLRFEILSGTYLPSPYMYIVFFPPPQPPQPRQANWIGTTNAMLFMNLLLLNVAFVI